MRTALLICASLVALMVVVTGCEVDYTVEHKGDSCVKFEDAMYLAAVVEGQEIWEEWCLGEDGYVETDTFEITVEGDVTEIEVTLKAGGGKDSQQSGTIVPGVDDDVAILGFTVELTDVTDGTYTFTVTSDAESSTAALSNITFCFGDATVLLPEEGSDTISRDTERTAPEELE